MHVRCRFTGEAQNFLTLLDDVDVSDLLHQYCATPNFEIKIRRSKEFAMRILHQRTPNAPKFEDRSQEETQWQGHWAREAAWKLAKKILKPKETQS